MWAEPGLFRGVPCGRGTEHGSCKPRIKEGRGAGGGAPPPLAQRPGSCPFPQTRALPAALDLRPSSHPACWPSAWHCPSAEPRHPPRRCPEPRWLSREGLSSTADLRGGRGLRVLWASGGGASGRGACPSRSPQRHGPLWPAGGTCGLGDTQELAPRFSRPNHLLVFSGPDAQETAEPHPPPPAADRDVTP